MPLGRRIQNGGNFLFREAMLGFLRAQVEFQEDGNDPVIGSAPLLNGIQKVDGIHRLNHRGIWQDQLEFIGLEVADEMPFYIPAGPVSGGTWTRPPAAPPPGAPPVLRTAALKSYVRSNPLYESKHFLTIMQLPRISPQMYESFENERIFLFCYPRTHYL